MASTRLSDSPGASGGGALSPAAELQRRWRLGQPPRIEQFLSECPARSLAELAAISRVDLRQRWRCGERPTAREYLDRFPPLADDSSLAVDLIYTEYLVREELGLQPLAANFQSQFPEYAEELSNQIELHAALSTGNGSSLAAADTAPLVPTAEPTLPSDLHLSKRLPSLGPDYEIEGEIGRGGMGVVYRARHVRLNRSVALKMVRAAETASDELLFRFRTEAETVARLHHPHIVQIYDYGQHDGLPFLALELIEGTTLAARASGRPWPARQAAELIATLARAIQFAHEQGVIHRDLKPGNVLLSVVSCPLSVAKERAQLTTDHRQLTVPKITDFGLAKVFGEAPSCVTQTGAILGTPSYMAPEQAAGQVQRIGPATDVYSLGAMLYELLTGRPPFHAQSPIETLQQVITRDPVSLRRLQPQLSRDLETICGKCLAKEPSQRYASAGELGDDLDRFLTDRPIKARPVGLLERSWRWCRRNPLLSSLTAAVAGLLVTVAAVSAVFSIHLNSQLLKTQHAEDAERQARLAAQERLFDSYLAEMTARLKSRQVGQRVATLETVDKAQRVLDEIGRSPERIRQLRNAAISALALPDLRRKQNIGGFPIGADHMALAAAADRYVVSTSAGDLVVYRLHDGEELFRLPHQGVEVVAAISPDGKYVGLTDSRGSKIWRLNNKQAKIIFDEQGATCLTFSPEPSQATISRADGRMHLLDLDAGQSIRLLGRGPARTQFAFHPASRRAVVCGASELQVVSLDTGAVESELAAPVAATRFFPSLAWHPSGEFLAAAGDDGIALWHVASGERRRTYPQASNGIHLYFVNRGEQLLSCDAWSGNLRLWQTHTGEELIHSPIFQHFTSDETSAGDRVLLARDGSALALWKVETETVCQTFSLGQHLSLGPVFSIAVSPEGRVLSLGHRDGMSLWDLTQRRCVQLELGGVCFTRFAADGSLMARCESGVYRWPSQVLPSDEQHPSASQHRATTWCYGPPEKICGPTVDAKFAMTPAADIVVVCAQQGWQVVRPKSAKPVLPINVPPDPRLVAISASGNWVALGRWHRTGVTVVDSASGASVAELPVGGQADVHFSPDQRWLVTSPEGGQLWHTDNWQPGPKLQARGSPSSGLAILFSPDSRVLALSQPTGEIRLVDPTAGQDWAVLSHPTGSTGSCLAFSPDQSTLVVQRWNGEPAPAVWNLALLRRELAQHGLDWPADVLRLQSPPDSQQSDSLTLAFDDGNLPRKQAAAALLRQASQTPTEDLSKLFERAIELDPENALAHNNLAWRLATTTTEVGETAEALVHARRAVELDNQRHSYLNTLGVALYRAGELDEAIDALKKSLAGSTPSDSEYDLIFLALCCAQQGDWAAAQEFYSRAASVHQEHLLRRTPAVREELDRFLAEARAAGLQ